MNKIEVAVLNQAHACPAGMMAFLGRLTQKGHNITNMQDLKDLYNDSMRNHAAAEWMIALPHGTIKRFTPITVAIVGASRRFLAQARTNQVGITYVSASLQYSDYSNKASFVVPYEVIASDVAFREKYANKCANDESFYRYMIDNGCTNDTAGYCMNQALRNVLVINANHEAWLHFIRLRSCNRNTEETQYVATLIWEALLNTNDGPDMFAFAGPDCLYGMCREGKMSCGEPIMDKLPMDIIAERWPLLERKHG